MQTFTHGQRVEVIENSSNDHIKIGEILRIKRIKYMDSEIYECVNSNNNIILVYARRLKPATPKTLDEIAVGDVIVGNDGDECLILMRSGEVVVMGSKEDFGYRATSNYTIAELKHYKYTVKQDEVTTPAPTKLTVAQIAEKLGYEVEVVKG